ncbi:hypothetical protein Vafri_639 [Volvox africanus]|nr:hypothetical protein Vafri_639 [Volvox africanus]
MGVQVGQLTLEWPLDSDPRIMDLVEGCIQRNPAARPSFNQLISQLTSLEALIRLEAPPSEGASEAKVPLLQGNAGSGMSYQSPPPAAAAVAESPFPVPAAPAPAAPGDVELKAAEAAVAAAEMAPPLLPLAEAALVMGTMGEVAMPMLVPPPLPPEEEEALMAAAAATAAPAATPTAVLGGTSVGMNGHNGHERLAVADDMRVMV